MIIGLCGSKGSGKSTVAEYLSKKYNFEVIAFSNPLKEVAKIFGFSERQLNGTQSDKLEINPKLGICAREFMQKFGTDICRDQRHITLFPKFKDKSIWIGLMENYINDKLGQRICVSDIRFLDELNFIREYNNSIVIQICRHDIDIDSYSNHASETSIKNIVPDYQINNNGSLDELYKNIDNIIYINK